MAQGAFAKRRLSSATDYVAAAIVLQASILLL